MPDFTHPFWSWFVAIITIVSIVALVWLTMSLTVKRKKTDDPVETMGHVWDENLEELNNPLPRWWINLFYITMFWGVVYLILYPGLGAFKGVLGWSQFNQYESEVATADAEYAPLFEQFQNVPIEELATNNDAIEIGGRLFSTYCTTCHGSDARGARGFPNLRDTDWLYGGTPKDIVQTIEGGRSGVMPPWAELLDEQQIAAASKYVLHLAGRNIDRAAVNEGKPVYETNCVACHGAGGEGNPLLGAPKLSDDIWLYGGSELKVRESISAGRVGVMPPHGEFLGAAKVHLLATYVYKISRPAEN